MRWLRFTLFFLAIVLFLFSLYLWSYRVELIQTTIEQACPPYHVSIESIEISSPKTIQLNNLCFSHNEHSLEIERIELVSHSWLSWLLIPSSSPLHINSATLYLKNVIPLSFGQPHFPFPVSLDTITIYWPDDTISTKRGCTAPLHEILEQILLKST